MLLFLLLPTRQEDLSNIRDKTCMGRGSLITPLTRHAANPIQCHCPRHMALGELVRTTLTSLGSPDHLHPEDCGKLSVMWDFKRPRAVQSSIQTPLDYSPSACWCRTVKPDTAVRDEPLAVGEEESLCSNSC